MSGEGGRADDDVVEVEEEREIPEREEIRQFEERVGRRRRRATHGQAEKFSKFLEARESKKLQKKVKQFKRYREDCFDHTSESEYQVYQLYHWARGERRIKRRLKLYTDFLLEEQEGVNPPPASEDGRESDGEGPAVRRRPEDVDDVQEEGRSRGRTYGVRVRLEESRE